MPESAYSIPLHVSVDRASVSGKMPFESLLGNRLVSWAVENKTCMQAEVGSSFVEPKASSLWEAILKKSIFKIT